ncbi:MAG: hypothetical protein JWR12_3036 [Mucilaginibacter sp.]|nr:hypothetical protein [Mucilaginibacter sp.]
MDHIISKIFSFITDKSKKCTSRVLMILSIILIALLTNNISGFSYYYNLNHQLTSIKQLNSILKDNSIPATDKDLLNNMRTDAITHLSLVDKFWNFLKSTDENLRYSTVINLPHNIYYLLNFLTAAPFEVVMMILVCFRGIKTLIGNGSEITRRKDAIFLWVLGFEFLLYIMALVQVKMFASIGSFSLIYYRYTFNILINAIVISAYYFLEVYLPKRRSKNVLRAPVN